MEVDYTKIRLVAERYRDVRGLRLVVAGSALVAFFGVYVLAGGPGAFAGFVLALACAFGTIAIALQWVDRFYVSRFGRIVHSESSDTAVALSIGIGIVVTIANQWLGTFVLGAVVAAATMALWVAIRDWPLRWYYLLGVVPAIVASWIRFRLPGLSREMAEAIGLVIIGASFIPIGFLDHRLLTSVMRPRKSSEAPAALTTEKTEI